MKKLFALALAILFLAAPVGAATLRVPQDYPTIQAAVNAARSGDVVLVAPGTYGDVVHQPGGMDTTRCAVVMKSGITLRGSGPGVTIIDADSLGRGIHCGNVTGSMIRDLTVREAWAEVHGSGIFLTEASSVAIFNCEITHNYDGGIIYFLQSGGAMSSCTITNNKAKQGGGLAIEFGSSPQVQFCTITGNQAPMSGGVYIDGYSAPRISDCTISNNFLNSPNGNGAGLYVKSAQPTFVNIQILDNLGDGRGGGVLIESEATVAMTNCLIQGNSTTSSRGHGGGIYVEYSDVTLQDCTITRNWIEGAISDGAGIYVYNDLQVLTIRQCTIAANSNDGEPTLAGGIACCNTTPVTIEKSIIAFNDPGKGIECLDSTSPVISCTDVYGNAAGDQICGTDAGHNFHMDPLFCDMAQNNFRIQMNSPCFPGRHPDGPHACDYDRIGGQDPGCNPAGTEDVGTLPGETRLLGNAPNPFRPNTTIEFEVADPGLVTLRIFDAAGRQVRLLVNRPYPAGRHRIAWNGRCDTGEFAASGVYFYRLSVNGVENSRRMVLSR